MTLWQKAVKYAAIALAVLLIVSIIGGILGVFGILGWITEKDGVDQDMIQYPVSGTVNALEIHIVAADFTIKQADRFSVESNLKNLSVKESGGVLTIREKDSFATNYSGASLVLYIPAGFVFEDAQIETGAGRVQIGVLSAGKLELELGAGQVEIGELNASSRAKIEGGAGKVTVTGGTLYNLDLEMGVGQLKLTSALRGDCELDMGVGEANVTLVGTQADYRIRLQKGIGNATVEGVNGEAGGVYGTGVNEIEINGGVGSIKVSFQGAEKSGF